MKHFRFRELSELQQEAERIGATHVHFVPAKDAVRQLLARRPTVGGRELANSLAIHPMEGCDGTLDGRPGDLTWRRYDRFAAGGAGLIWFEATAVSGDGRANTRQLWLRPDNVGDFARLRDRIRQATGALVPLQLTHSGRYSVPVRKIAVDNPYVKPAGAVISDSELERLEDDFFRAAGLALQAGFDAVDLKMTHGYLLSELLGAKTRPGPYGGPLENRLRFARNVLGKIKAAYGNRLLLCVRLGCFDSIPYNARVNLPYANGFGVNPDNPHEEDLTEVLAAIRALEQSGVGLLNVSIGCPYYNPHITRPFEKPDEGNYETPEHPLLGVDRHFRIAGALQRAFPHLPMVGSGYSWLQRFAIHAAAANLESGAIRIAGFGRAALAYPDFAKAALATGELDERRVCKTLTFCTYLMRQKHNAEGQFATGCPPFDKEVYGEIIKIARATKP